VLDDTLSEGAGNGAPRSRVRAFLARSGEELRAARARARGRRRPELVLEGLLLLALVVAIALDIGRLLGGVLFVALLVPLHVLARRNARRAAPTTRKA
jgi:hypothetical protein